MYNATAPKEDPMYTAGVLDWTHRAVAAIHNLGMLVIPNFSPPGYAFTDEILEVANATDGLLAEAGWTIWDPVPNTSSFTTPPLKTSPARFAAQVSVQMG